jgi:hypothetical protein
MKAIGSMEKDMASALATLRTATNIKASGKMAANMAKALYSMLMAAIMLAFGILTGEFNDASDYKANQREK